MNKLYSTTSVGTMGELIVQLHLLEYDVQAAPPLKDSGNDLIAIRNREFRAIQVRCTTTEDINKPDENVLYHILAIVNLPKRDNRYITNESQVYLFALADVGAISKPVSKYKGNLLSQELVEKLFSPPKHA
jgi:hypothetical protein